VCFQRAAARHPLTRLVCNKTTPDNGTMSVSTGRLALFVGCLVPRLSYCVPAPPLPPISRLKIHDTHTHSNRGCVCGGNGSKRVLCGNQASCRSEKVGCHFLRHFNTTWNFRVQFLTRRSLDFCNTNHSYSKLCAHAKSLISIN
jgi:hypothetical protein